MLRGRFLSDVGTGCFRYLLLCIKSYVVILYQCPNVLFCLHWDSYSVNPGPIDRTFRMAKFSNINATRFKIFMISFERHCGSKSREALARCPQQCRCSLLWPTPSLRQNFSHGHFSEACLRKPNTGINDLRNSGYRRGYPLGAEE